MATPYIGEIRCFGFNFAPRYYMLASGQLLPIAQNTALFSILGTTYGGNGQSNFQLPNLNGTMPGGNGNGPGLTPRVLGETFGSENVTLLITEMPAHIHSVTTKVDPASQANMTDVPTAGYFLSRFSYAGTSAANAWYKPAAGPNPTPTTLHPQTLSVTGGGQAHNNQQPYLTINWCIAVQGAFPARN